MSILFKEQSKEVEKGFLRLSYDTLRALDEHVNYPREIISFLLIAAWTYLGTLTKTKWLSIHRLYLLQAKGDPWKKSIWWWGSSSSARGSMDYFFITIAPSSILARSRSTQLGPIYGLNKTSVLGITKNFIWWWGFSSVALGVQRTPSLPLLPGPL